MTVSAENSDRIGPDEQWLSVPEVGEKMGVMQRQVRELLRQGQLVAMRRGANNALMIPASFLITEELTNEVTIVPTLAGTVTLLKDSGLDDVEIVEWLLSENSELGDTPIDVLRQGHIHPVRRAAQLLG